MLASHYEGVMDHGSNAHFDTLQVRKQHQCNLGAADFLENLSSTHVMNKLMTLQVSCRVSSSH